MGQQLLNLGLKLCWYAVVTYVVARVALFALGN